MRTLRTVLPLTLLLLFPACKSNEDFCAEVCLPGEDVYVCGGQTTNNRICSVSSAAATAQCGELGVVGQYSCGSGNDEAGEEGGDDEAGSSQEEQPEEEGGASQPSWAPDDFIWYDRDAGTTVVARELIDIIAADGGIIAVNDSTSMVPLEGGHFRLDSVGRDDLAYHLGFMEGDIIRSANGIDLSSAADYMLAIGALAAKPKLSIVVTRAGAAKTILIRIE